MSGHGHGEDGGHGHGEEGGHGHGEDGGHGHGDDGGHGHGEDGGHGHGDEAGHAHGHGDGQVYAAKPLPDAPLPPPLPPGVGGVLYIDAKSGVAGDMFVAALLDLGVPESVFREGLLALGLQGFTWSHRRLARAGVAARKFDVEVSPGQPQRTYRTILEILNAAKLPDGAKRFALAVFERLAHAEAKVHAMEVLDVHFHEVGAIDSIVDIVCVALGVDYLGATVHCSPLPVGSGTVHAQHGQLPLPAPATLLCLEGAPIYGTELNKELVTPTGAALARTLAERRFGPLPPMKPIAAGWGAGTRDLPDRPNLVRLVLGESSSGAVGLIQRTLTLLEANIDDQNPEITAHALDQIRDAGALDVWLTPILMKKGRAATELSVLLEPEAEARVVHAILEGTTTLGLRVRSVDRRERPRRMIQVETKFGPIDVKIAEGTGLTPQAAPEFESCRRAAEAHDVPIRNVFNAALAATLRAAEETAQGTK